MLLFFHITRRNIRCRYLIELSGQAQERDQSHRGYIGSVLELSIGCNNCKVGLSLPFFRVSITC